MPWTQSLKLYDAGFKDSYREVHPDVVDYPGFTWAVNSPWIDADERDRIDFIYYYDQKGLQPINSYVVGPREIYINLSTKVVPNNKETVLLPQSVWPSDHRAVITTFSYQKD